jgi:hypothetical protein
MDPWLQAETVFQDGQGAFIVHVVRARAAAHSLATVSAQAGQINGPRL